MNATLPQCPGCSATLPAALLNRGTLMPCPLCQAQLQVELFPAFFRQRASGQTGEAVVIEGEAGCFNHPEKKAVVPCQGCGRFLCALCDCELHGRHYCPACLEAGQKKGRISTLEQQRTLYDSVALALALLPIVTVYLTCITAPMALYIALRHWNAPRSLVHRSRARLVAAVMLAVLQLGAWGVFIYLVATT